MKTITINVEEEIENTFRKRAYQIYGKKKGTLGKAVNEAMKEWAIKRKYLEQCMNLLKNGIDMGKIMYTKREELYGRN